MQFTTNPAFAALEAAYATYLEAWGAWMVAHHAGAEPTRDAALGAVLVAARESVAAALMAASWDQLDAADAAALENIRACLPDMDAWAAPLDGLSFEDTVGSAAATAAVPGAGPTAAVPGTGLTATRPEGEDLATLRRTTFDAWGEAMANLVVDGETMDRLTATGRISREEDPGRRRRLFLAMEPAWRILNDDDGPGSPYRRLVRASAARWARESSPIEANAAALGMAPAAVEPTMRRVLAAFRAVALGPDLIEPWDYRYRVGGLARRLDALVPIDRLREINDAHLRAIGADPEALSIHYDIRPRAGRPVIPTAFTVTADIARPLGAGDSSARPLGAVDAAGSAAGDLSGGRQTTTGATDGWRPATPWVFATHAEGGIGNLEELLHESGHALHYAALRARPAHFAWPPDQTAFVEAVADVIGWTTHEPAFLREQLGETVSTRESVIARFGNVVLDAAWTLFEIELHRHPDRSPNEAWAEIAERDLGVRGHPEWAWWAVRGQLIDGPGYLANYALGAVMVAAVRARIRAVRGDWSTGDPGWYAFVSEHLLRFAGARTPRDLLTGFLGGPMTAEALLADIARAA